MNRQILDKELTQIANKCIESDYFLVQYGSQCTMNEIDNTKDIDLCIIIEDRRCVDEALLINEIKKLFIKMNIVIDEEIPFKNKLIFTYANIFTIGTLYPYYKTSNLTQDFIMNRDKAALCSEDTKLRLLINILTTQNKLIKGDESVFRKFIELGFESLIFVYLYFYQDLTMEKMLAWLKGENLYYKDWLGYSPSNLKWLNSELQIYIDILVKSGQLVSKMNSYELPLDVRTNFDRLKTRKLNFANNFNSLLPNDKFKKYIQNKLDEIFLYPKATNEELENQIAQIFEIDRTSLFFCNGTMDGFNELLKLFPQKKISLFDPTFWGYEYTAKTLGNSVHYIDSNSIFNYSINTFSEAAEQSDVIFICNPNNPTLANFDSSSVYELCQKYPNTFFIIDETMLLFDENYITKSSIKKVGDLENVAIVASFSKIFSLGGVRAGFIKSSKSIIKQLQHKRVLFSTPSITQLSINYYLNDFECIKRGLKKLHENKEKLVSQLSQLTSMISTINSEECNFILVELPIKKFYQLKEVLEVNKIDIRDASDAYVKLQNYDTRWFRITVGTEEDNDVLVNIIQKMNTFYLNKESHALCV